MTTTASAAGTSASLPGPHAITVYSKPACVQCTATTRAFDGKGVEYNYVDLTQDPAAMDHVVSLGYRQAPVVEAYGQHWAGFLPKNVEDAAAEYHRQKAAIEVIAEEVPESDPDLEPAL